MAEIAPRRLPLVPEDLVARRADPLTPWARAVWAVARAAHEQVPDPALIAKRHWPSDSTTISIVQRTATMPATTTTSGWASQLVEISSVGLMKALGRGSAAARLASRAITVTAARQVSVPALTFGTSLSFVLEGGAVPVYPGITTAVVLTPRKLAGIVALTRQIVEHSDPAIEQMIRVVLAEHLASRLDALMLDASAGSAARPAGLRNGIAAITATTGGGESAMISDIGNLVSGVVGVSGGDIVIIAAPEQWAALQTKFGANLPYPVLYSAGLANGDVIAIAPAALVIGMDETPRIESSGTATLHLEDATPLAIGTVGTPNTVAAPSMSLFQVDAIGVRIIWRACWALRSSAGLAHTTAVTW